MNEAQRTLNEMFESHAPACIFPFGLDRPVYRVIGEGFVYAGPPVLEGIVFLEGDWKNIDTANPLHLIAGTIAGPHDARPEDAGFSRYWTIGDKAIVYELTDEALTNGVDLYLSGLKNQQRSAKEIEADRALAKRECDDLMDAEYTIAARTTK